MTSIYYWIMDNAWGHQPFGALIIGIFICDQHAIRHRRERKGWAGFSDTFCQRMRSCQSYCYWWMSLLIIFIEWSTRHGLVRKRKIKHYLLWIWSFVRSSADWKYAKTGQLEWEHSPLVNLNPRNVFKCSFCFYNYDCTGMQFPNRDPCLDIFRFFFFFCGRQTWCDGRYTKSTFSYVLSFQS